jgi:DNA ligase-1
MRDFATLVNTLDSTNKTLLKQEAIARYLTEADEVDKLWFLALFTGKKPKRNVNSSDMKRWAMELAGIPEWLFVESYATVGDLAETLSLLLPNTPTVIDLS